ncbi:MAG: hypothetical protein IPI65_15600 [Bacteroidetes bacterium]|nr:hypothetical protein [Bacteroidota bacterium]
MPTLQLNVSGRPTLKTSWAFDIYTYQYLNGVLGSAYGKQVVDSLRPSIQNPIEGTRLGGSMILNLGINLLRRIQPRLVRLRCAPVAFNGMF